MVAYRRYKSEFHFLDEVGNKHRFPSLANNGTIVLSVIVPAKNEENRLPSMLDECIEHLEQRSLRDDDFTWEVLVVDDGSVDRTTEVALRYVRRYTSERVRVLTLARNRGKGGAVRLGMMSARGRYLLFADADGATTFGDVDKIEKSMCQHMSTKRIEKLTKLPKHASDDRAAIICGSRAHLEKESIAKRSIFRTILMFGFHLLVWLFCVRTVHDTQCGFKMFSRKAARQTFGNQHIERWAFDVELLYIAETLNISLDEVAVQWQEIDGSKITPVLSWLQVRVCNLSSTEEGIHLTDGMRFATHLATLSTRLVEDRAATKS